MKRYLSGFFIIIFLYGICGCTPGLIPVTTIPGEKSTGIAHPAWSGRTNIYEVNIRQFSPEGTFSAFEKSLPRLKKMGVEILWFMPVTPIGVIDRKGSESELGSPYAVKNYTKVNPDFGTMADFKNLVKQAHKMGFKVLTDWVANHTSPDNPWMYNHPAFYRHDSLGRVVIPFDWTDTRQLDYSNPELRDSMIAAMEFWIRETDIDGFRCDVAHLIPDDFWKECIDRLRKLKFVFMLAEGETPELHYAGFDATYTWSLMRPMEEVYKQTKDLAYFDSVIHHNISSYPQNAMRLFFTTNHDENSWNGTEFEKYGDAFRAFAVFTQTMYQSIPLIYNGQEIPNEKRLKFFVKDPLQWNQYAMAPFYSTLLHLRKKNKALDANAAYQRLTTCNDNAIFCYIRQKKDKQILTVLNLSPQPQSFTIDDRRAFGKVRNVFSGEKFTITNDYPFEMNPWGFLVFEY